MAERNRGYLAGAVAILFLALSWTAVILRVYVRAVMIKTFGIDDYLCVLTLLLFTAYCGFVLDGVHYGTGQHITEISSVNFIIGMKAWWIAEVFYVSCTTVLKLSIGFFLLRVCVKKIQRKIIWVVIGTVTLYSCYYFMLVILQCQPLSYFWNRFDLKHQGKCASSSVISVSTYVHSGLSVWADWTLGILPAFLVWDLNMNPRTKVSVAIILALGALGSTASIVRIPFIYQLTETFDFLYANVDVSIWSTVEPGIGLTASALATLRPLFMTFFSRSRLLGSSTATPAPSYGFHSKHQSRNGYLRSGNGIDNRSLGAGAEELGLSGIKTENPKEAVISTTIQSVNDSRYSSDDRIEKVKRQGGEMEDEAVKRVQKFGGLRRKSQLEGLGSSNSPESWNSSESRFAEDSSTDDITLPISKPPKLAITKTTEFTTTREWKSGPARRKEEDG